jgi:hypothetical protein
MQQQDDRKNEHAPESRQPGQQTAQPGASQGGAGGQPGSQEEGGEGPGDRRNPADNLTREARIRGGMHSAKNQQRDAFGQFAGRKGSAEDASRTVRGRRARGRGEGAAGSQPEDSPPPRDESEQR